MTTEDRHTHWRTIIDNQTASGMNIAAYCRESHIHPSLFYTWRRKLRKRQPPAGGFLELIPGRLTEAATSGIRIRLGGKLAVEVERGFDPFTLRAVVETLSEHSRCSG
jgi:transposase-like protein